MGPKKKVNCRILAVFCFLCAGIAAFLYVWEGLPYIRGRAEAERLEEISLKGQAGGGMHQESSLSGVPLTVDFEALKAVNPDIIGWILIPGTQVNDPILKHQEEDAYYLTHTPEKKESKLGSIYMHHDAAADFTDAHTILFGHNMRSGQRFGELSEYADREFAEENPDVWIFLPGETLRCTVYSAYACPVDDLTYTIGYQTGEEAYRDLLCHTVKSSQIRMEDLPSGMDRIITLSTCTDSGDKGRRFVVNCFAAEKRELSGKEGMQNRKKIRKNICR